MLEKRGYASMRMGTFCPISREVKVGGRHSKVLNAKAATSIGKPVRIRFRLIGSHQARNQAPALVYTAFRLSVLGPIPKCVNDKAVTKMWGWS